MSAEITDEMRKVRDNAVRALTPSATEAAYRRGREDERERAARVVENFPYHEWHEEYRPIDLKTKIAAAIRSAP